MKKNNLVKKHTYIFLLGIIIQWILFIIIIFLLKNHYYKGHAQKIFLIFILGLLLMIPG